MHIIFCRVKIVLYWYEKKYTKSKMKTNKLVLLWGHIATHISRSVPDKKGSFFVVHLIPEPV